VLLNLAINARDAMPEGGELTLRARAPRSGEPAPIAGELTGRGRAVIEVVDTGCGMSAEVAERAFEPFYTTKDLGEGSGLGLATVYGIVQQLGGAVELESAPGRGTTVRLHLPLDAEEPGAEGGAAPGAGRAATTILVVEDEEHVRRLVTRVLETRGHRVLVAEHGRAALEVARGHDGHIDLLLSDMVMPHLGGRDLAEELKRERPELEVILMSGYSEDGRDSRLEAGGRVHFLGKPFLPSDLVERVREVLGSDG
jgi:CheY-like chemotaxis protein